MVTVEWNEIICLAAYLEGGGLKGNNLSTLNYIDHVTRGGTYLFILALDGNVEPEAWDKHAIGGTIWLDKMNAEFVVVQNSKFTCVAGDGLDGGSMIDYFIM